MRPPVWFQIEVQSSESSEDGRRFVQIRAVNLNTGSRRILCDLMPVSHLVKAELLIALNLDDGQVMAAVRTIDAT